MEQIFRNIYSSYQLAIAKVVDYRSVLVPVLLLFVLFFQTFRFYLLPFMGIMPQDAYYYLYGENLDWSYFDHPGMVGYLARMFSEILGKSVYTLKFMDFFLTSIALVAFYRLSRLFLSETKTMGAIVLMASSLLITILSLNTTPDVPLFLFWILSLTSLHGAIFLGKNKQWIYSGVFMGFAILSKYTAIFLPIGLLIFLTVSKEHRRFLRTAFPYLALFLVLLFTLPILYWNYQHDFASFGFQAGERVQRIFELKFSFTRFLGFLGSQALIILPITFGLLILIVIRNTKHWLFSTRRMNNELLFLTSFCLPLFLIFTLVSPFYWIKINWLIPAYVTGVIVVARYIRKKLISIQTSLAILLHIALAVEIIFYPVPIKSDDTWFGWSEVSEKVKAIKTKYPDDFVFSADNYKTASILNFYLDEKIYSSNIVGGNGLQYSILDQDLHLLKGQNALFIDSESRFENLSKTDNENTYLNRFFGRVDQLPPIIIRNNFNLPVRKFLVYRCLSYNPPDQFSDEALKSL